MLFELPIVLTGTITPRAVMTKYLDSAQRRIEYISSIKYYSQFAPVFFLENSGYDLLSDEEFTALPNTILIQHKPSINYNKGKGYQEFEMLDSWIDTFSDNYNGFLKITGRYIVKNIISVLNDCENASPFEAIFERKLMQPSFALTDVFYINKRFYSHKLKSCYLFVNDSKGIYIEHIVGRILAQSNKCRVFKVYPIKTGITGSVGYCFSDGKQELLKRAIRNTLFYIKKDYRLV